MSTVAAVWTAFGVALAVLSRGAALATGIGIGILYRLTTRKLSGRSISEFFGVIQPVSDQTDPAVKDHRG